jgi:predicted transcriptional regulator
LVDSFGEISFLTRSENRVEVLTTLADRPHTERELVTETDISDVTVGRVLDDFVDRGWVRENEGLYRVSRVGELLAADYRRLEGSMDVACRLGPVLEYLPVAEMDFDFRHLIDARISDPETFDPLRAVDRWKQLIRHSDHVVGTAPVTSATTVVAEPFHEAITEHDMRFEVVVSTEYYETASAKPEMRELLRQQLRAGMEMFLTSEDQEPLPFTATFDEIATISGYDDAGTLRVGIETRAEPVFEWVRETYETYRENARRLTPEDFAE